MAAQDELSLKRKTKTTAGGAARKRTKTLRSVGDLPWKTIAHARDTTGEGDNGILELEEVENVEVVYENTDSGRMAVFRVADPKESTDNDFIITEGTGPNSPANANGSVVLPDLVTFDSALLPEWIPYELHAILARSLHARGFLVPTPIQAQALPPARDGRDVIGVAETGSGKTLAYGLPILSKLLEEMQTQPLREKRHVSALVLTPTRELALQVSSHLNACLTPPSSSDAEDAPRGKPSKATKGRSAETAKSKGSPLVSVAAIVGGMSAQKQRRVLSRGADILIATPGRFWDLLEEDEELAEQIKNLKFLVLDEADRMIETGHFEELDHILRLTMRNKDTDDAEFSEEDNTGGSKARPNDTLQTFVFSATMSKDLQRNLKVRMKTRAAPNNRRKLGSTLDDLLLRLDFRDPDPLIIDISPERGVVATLKESRVECLSAEKDVYLYYFLLRYPGRSLVFLSAIDGIRRLIPLMDLIGLKAYPLHSQLEQRQRLKNLDRFKSTPNSILLATDIAARGLDIPAVDHVLHYQLPRTADVYVHRNGRTARASRDGFSLLMCAPDERRIFHGLLSSLNRDEAEIPEMAVELYMLDRLKTRVQLARKIETSQHKVQKANHERKWLRETAEAMELVLDSDMDSDEEQESSKRERKSAGAKTAALKAELKVLLAQPLIARGVSARYITSGSLCIVDDIINNQHHETMLGAPRIAAGNEVVAIRKRKPKVVVEHEDWAGIEG